MKIKNSQESLKSLLLVFLLPINNNVCLSQLCGTFQVKIDEKLTMSMHCEDFSFWDGKKKLYINTKSILISKIFMSIKFSLLKILCKIVKDLLSINCRKMKMFASFMEINEMEITFCKFTWLEEIFSWPKMEIFSWESIDFWDFLWLDLNLKGKISIRRLFGLFLIFNQLNKYF